MKGKSLKFTGFALLLIGLFAIGCSSKDNKITVPSGPYGNGFFIINEGWFGHEQSSVNFYKYGEDTIHQMVYSAENNGASPTVAGSNLENATIYNNRIYLISKTGGPITVADAGTLKKIGEINFTGSDWRSLTGIDNTTAYVSGDKGIYKVNLSSLTVSNQPFVENNAVGNITKVDNNLYASANGGVDIINITTGQISKHYDGPTQGYVQVNNGKVFGGYANLLIAFDNQNLDTTQIHLAAPIWSDDWSFHMPSIVGSSKENAVFYIAGPSFTPNQIYKYVDGNLASLSQPFITLPVGEQFYETGIAYDKKQDQIVTCSITGYTATDTNYLRFYNAKTGDLVRTVSYVHPYFPAMIVFQN